MKGNGREEPPVAATEGGGGWRSVVLERHYIQSRTAIIAAPAGTFTRPSNTKSHYTARRAAPANPLGDGRLACPGPRDDEWELRSLGSK